MDITSWGIICALCWIPAVLWGIPRLRRRAGLVITPAKSIPLGCLTMVLVPSALWGLWARLGMDRKEPLDTIVLCLCTLLGLLAGVVVFRLAEELLRRIYRRAAESPETHPGKESDRGIYLVVLFFCILLGMGGCVVGGIVEFNSKFLSKEGCRGDWRYIPLLREHGMKIDFCEQPIHPFLAEYNYRLYFNDGKRTSIHCLHTNCGGRTFFNVYRLPDGRLHLVDKDAEYLVDPKSRAVLRLFRRAGERKFFTAPYPDEEVTSWSTAPFQDKGTWYVDFNHRRVEATPADGILDGEIYFGRIADNRFQSAAESPEVPLEEWRSVR